MGPGEAEFAPMLQPGSRFSKGQCRAAADRVPELKAIARWMADWAAEGACRAPDECWVELRGTCPHGLVSWQVVLDDLVDLDAATLHPGS